MRLYNRTRYVYTPLYGDESMLSSVHLLIVAKRLFYHLCLCLGYVSKLETNQDWEDWDYLLTLQIQSLWTIPRSYYEYWMIYAMLRGIFFHYFEFDIERLKRPR